MRRFEIDFDMTARYEGIVAHVDVDVALAGVAPDDHPTLAHHVFEFFAFQPCNGGALAVGRPGHAMGRRRGGLLKG